MIEEDIRKLFEEIDPEGKIPQAKMEEFVAAVKNLETNPPKDGDTVGAYKVSVLGDLKSRLDAETDWKKRAAIAAKIISIDLE